MTSLTVPLAPGDSVGHWRLGRRTEARFDVPDQPMQGEMDPFFFLTKVENYIPHEYPCRTAFAARHRGRHPVPTAGFEPAGWWFPFGSPRVDLSGFWFRPTVVECRARTALLSPAAQTARMRFATCGGAILTVNGREIATLSRYQRNLEEAVEVDVPLVSGANQIEVWFGDLCERDTRYYFALGLLAGDGLAVAVPVATAPERAAEIERLLNLMQVERPFCGDGEVAIRLPHPTSVALDVAIDLQGDFISADRLPASQRLPAGATRIVVGAVADLPADFRHIQVTLSEGGFALGHVVTTEICDLAATGPASADPVARAEEALAHVADKAEPGTVRALARLAVGLDGAETEAMILASLPAIVDCHDCADFALVPLLWCRIGWGDRLSAATRAAVDDAILRFRYWMDEPGSDVMWFFSENHALLFHTACYLAGDLFPDARFVRSGRTGAAQRAVGRQRLNDWFDHFETFEMAEWNSAPYFPVDLKGLATLVAIAPDAELRDRARRAVLRLLELVALSAHQGVLTASQGRSYEHSLRPGRTLELSAIARLMFGRGWYGRRVHALPQMALAVRDHGLRADPRLTRLAFWDDDQALEWCFRQGEGGIAALYHHKTRDHAMGSIAGYRPGEWGYQETMLHLRLGPRPESQIWINHPGERIVSGNGRPSFWGGCGSIPRVHQYRGLAVLDFVLKPGQVEFTHAWLPVCEMDEVRRDGNRLLVRAGGGLALLIGSGRFEPVEDGPSAGCEVRLPGMASRWIVRLSDLRREGSLDAFADRFATLGLQQTDDGGFVLADPDYGDVACRPGGIVEAEGRTLDPAAWTHAGRARLLPSGAEFPLPSSGHREI